MKRPLFDIWEDATTALGPLVPWKVQLVNYVGSFPTREHAESFVATTKRLRVQAAKSVK